MTTNLAQGSRWRNALRRRSTHFGLIVAGCLDALAALGVFDTYGPAPFRPSGDGTVAAFGTIAFALAARLWTRPSAAIAVITSLVFAATAVLCGADLLELSGGGFATEVVPATGWIVALGASCSGVLIASAVARSAMRTGDWL